MAAVQGESDVCGSSTLVCVVPQQWTISFVKVFTNLMASVGQ